MPIKVIAGLGNVGDEYKNTRHNIGFMVIDALAQAAHDATPWKRERKFNAEITKATISGQMILLVKPHTYMNRSGQCLKAIQQFYKFPLDALAVIYDDISLDLGRIKLSIRGSSAGHNGIKDLQHHLGQDAPFVRYRVGIGANSNPRQNLSDYVLHSFPKGEKDLIDAQIIKNIADLKLLVDKGAVEAMNLVNQKEKNNE